MDSKDLGKLGTWCKPKGVCDEGTCTNGVCLTIPTGGLGQPCNLDKTCAYDGLTCKDLNDGAGEKCYCADDSNIGKACDANGSECVGNSFNKNFQYIYPKMYVTVAGDKTTGTTATDSITCFNSCDATMVRANFDASSQTDNCYCYNTVDPKAYVVADKDSKWTAAFKDYTLFPKTTIPPTA
jgi:hypothetical protein